MRELEQQGLARMDAVKRVAKARGIPKRELYRRVISLQLRRGRGSRRGAPHSRGCGSRSSSSAIISIIAGCVSTVPRARQANAEFPRHPPRLHIQVVDDLHVIGEKPDGRDHGVARGFAQVIADIRLQPGLRRRAAAALPGEIPLPHSHAGATAAEARSSSATYGLGLRHGHWHGVRREYQTADAAVRPAPRETGPSSPPGIWDAWKTAGFLSMAGALLRQRHGRFQILRCTAGIRNTTRMPRLQTPARESRHLRAFARRCRCSSGCQFRLPQYTGTSSRRSKRGDQRAILVVDGAASVEVVIMLGHFQHFVRAERCARAERSPETESRLRVFRDRRRRRSAGRRRGTHSRF